MRLPEPPWATGIASVVLLSTVPVHAQEPGDSVVDPVVDSLVDEAWDSVERLRPTVDEPTGETLEVSLEAARAICLTNDLNLQGAQEVVEAARHRELGSWGAFDWIFNATGSLAESEADASNIFDAGTGTIDTSTQDLSFGFDRTFSTGGSLSLMYSHNNTKTNSFFNLLDTANQDVLAAVYTRPLMRGAGGDYNTSLQLIADMQWRREQESYRMTRQALLVEVDMLYWDLVLAELQMSVAGSALDLALGQLERDRRRRDAGVATDVEVIQDEATVAKMIEGVLLAETNLRSAMDFLRSTLFPGVGAETWTVQVKTITALPGPSTDEVPTDWQAEIYSALRHRGEVRMAELDVEIAILLHERTVSEKQPLLDVLLQLSSQGYDASVSTAFEEAFTYEFPSVSAGLNFQLPMSNVALDSEERAARAELRGARLQLDSLRSDVSSQLREALRRVRYHAEATRAASKSREAAERLMKAERSRHEQGLSTNFQVLEFQQALVEAQYAEHASRAAYGQSLASLAGARGMAGESSGGQAP